MTMVSEAVAAWRLDDEAIGSLVSEAQAGSQAAFADLTAEFIPLLRSSVRRWHAAARRRGGLDDADLLQEARIALMRAVGSYAVDLPGRVAFSRWLRWSVDNALRSACARGVPESPWDMSETGGGGCAAGAPTGRHDADATSSACERRLDRDALGLVASLVCDDDPGLGAVLTRVLGCDGEGDTELGRHQLAMLRHPCVRSVLVRDGGSRGEVVDELGRDEDEEPW
jgi:DNA-directed RNA polymerase specialized sigma24 family protein